MDLIRRKHDGFLINVKVQHVHLRHSYSDSYAVSCSEILVERLHELERIAQSAFLQGEVIVQAKNPDKGLM